MQTDGVDVVNVTARPEEAVALTVSGDWAIGLGAGVGEGDRLVDLLDREVAAHRGGRVVDRGARLVGPDGARAGADEGDRRPVEATRRCRPTGSTW